MYFYDNAVFTRLLKSCARHATLMRRSTRASLSQAVALVLLLLLGALVAASAAVRRAARETRRCGLLPLGGFCFGATARARECF